MVNLELYKIFVIVAEEKNVTKASNILHIAQPAITKHIKNLEEQLNKVLFVRSNKGVELTEDGKKLYKDVSDAIHLLMNEQKSKNIISIGSHNHMYNKIFGKSINEFCLKNPDINLNLINEETDTMLNMLEKHKLDIVFSKKVNNTNFNLKYIKLGYLNEIFIATKDSKYITEPINISDLENSIIYAPRAYSQTVNTLKEKINTQNLNIKNSSYNTILELTGSGEVIGIITEEYIDKKEFEKYHIIKAKNNLDIGKVEFGIYYKDRFDKLDELIEIIKCNYNK